MQLSEVYALARKLNQPVLFVGRLEDNFEQGIDAIETSAYESIEEAKAELDTVLKSLAEKTAETSIYALIGSDIKIVAIEEDPFPFDVCLNRIINEIAQLQCEIPNIFSHEPLTDGAILELARRAGLKSFHASPHVLTEKDKRLIGFVRLALIANKERAGAATPSIESLLLSVGAECTSDGKVLFPSVGSLAKYGRIISNICYG